MTNNTTQRAEINALEDACLGVALAIDEQSTTDTTTEPAETDSFMTIVMTVLQSRTEEHSEQRLTELEALWDTIQDKLAFTDGAFEAMAHRGADLGQQLREPPNEEVEPGSMVALAETESGRTVWGVNAEGWDNEFDHNENITLGMNADGTVEPISLDERGENTDEET